MHGNFNELVTTVMTATEGSETTSHNDDSRYVENADDNNIVKFELDISVPSFEVELMKLKLLPGIN